MPKLEAVRYPDQRLVTPTRFWDFENNPGLLMETKEVMDATLRAYGENALGIASTQVGSHLNLFSYWEEDEIRTLVNAEILEVSGSFEFQEGCLSIPNLSCNLVRPNKVLLLAQEMDGKEVEIEAEGVLGRLYQHEVDHLQGRLWWDRLDTHKRQVAKRKFRQGLTTTI